MRQSVEHSKQMLQLMDEKYSTFYISKLWLDPELYFSQKSMIHFSLSVNADLGYLSLKPERGSNNRKGALYGFAYQ